MRRILVILCAFALLGGAPVLALSETRPPSPAAVTTPGSALFVPLFIHQPEIPELEWDPRLDQRGATLIPADVLPGEGYWRLISARWYAEGEPPVAGLHHIFIDVWDSAGARKTGVPISILAHADGRLLATLSTEAKPGELYAANFPMYEIAPAYRAAPADGAPADMVAGIGLGDLIHPTWPIHTSYGLVWQWSIAPLPSAAAAAGFYG